MGRRPDETLSRVATANKRKAHTGRPLYEPDAQRLERWCESLWFSRDNRKRRYAIAISLGLYGLRQGEVSGTAIWQLRRDGLLTVRTLKRGTARQVQLNQHLADAIRQHHPRPTTDADPIIRTTVNTAGPTARLFGTAMHHATAIVGDHYGFHCLRHTAAMRLYNATHDVLAVMHMLGHASLSQTHKYLKRFTIVDDRGFPRWSTHPTRPWLRRVERPPAAKPSDDRPWWQTLWESQTKAERRTTATPGDDTCPPPAA